MAVYTPVPFDELQAFITRYDIGALEQADGILQGVENTNYLLRTTRGKYILTLFEKRVKAEDVPFFMGLMQHGAAKGLPCPAPVADRHGVIIQQLRGHSAAITTFLEGHMVEEVTLRHCRQLGGLLGEFHEKCADFRMDRPNPLSFSGWAKLAEAVAPRADEIAPGLAALIADELAYQQRHFPKAGTLPYGPIHADAFMDNVFFKDNVLSGIIDFYFACQDFFAYDVAITINAWCFENQKTFAPLRARSILEGYYLVRALDDTEHAAMPTLLRAASLRYLLTRTYDKLNHPPGAMVTPHDPMEYRNKLMFFRDNGFVL